MLNRDNAVGFVLLGVCAIVAVIMVISISTGERIRLDLNPVIGAILGVAFFALVIFGLARNWTSRRGGAGGRQWPDPQAGQRGRSLWDRVRGRGGDRIN